jgi:hypothetical protein
MLGRLQNHHPENNNDDLPPEFRGITKTSLYNGLVNEVLLPPLESKGVNKRYLVRVATNQIFRLNLLDFKRFEITLLPRHWKKQVYLNLGVLFRKLTLLMGERNLPELGFIEQNIPSEEYLIKVCRYIDQENITEAFLESCPNPTIVNSLSRQIHFAKIEAQQFLFGDNPALRSPKVLNMLQEVNDLARRVKNRRAELGDLDRFRQSLQAKILEDEGSLLGSLSNASLCILTIGGQMEQEAIFIEGDVARQNRHNLNEIQRL